MIEPTIIFSALTSSPEVTALAGQKVFPVTATQGTTFPYITYEVVSNTPERCRQGIANEAMRVQVSVFATSYKQVHALYKAVRERLEGSLSEAIKSEFLTHNDLYREEGDAYGKAIDFELINIKDN